MSHFQQHPAFFNKPIRLTEEEKKHPIRVIIDFFTDYNLSEMREINQNIDHVCLTSDVPPFDDPEERDNLLSYRESEERVMEAALIIMETHSDVAPSTHPSQSNANTNFQVIGTMDINEVQNRFDHVQNKVAEICNTMKIWGERLKMQFPEK